MGQQARVTVRYGDRTEQGRAVLETDELVFRGDDGLRLKIPFSGVRSATTGDGDLRIELADGTAVFALGAQAEKWAQKILHPKSLLDKLGIKPGMTVTVLGIHDDEFIAELRGRTDQLFFGNAQTNCDAIFVAVDGSEDMEQLAELKGAIKPNGAVWAVFRKGRKDFNENDVLRGGLAAGLVDVKVVRFSETHTASKFVIRKSQR
jgi:hypothetical protein